MSEAQEARLKRLLPAVKAIIKAQPKPEAKNPNVFPVNPAPIKAEDVTIEMLADYDHLLDFAVERTDLTLHINRPFLVSTKVLTVPSYNSGWRELPDTLAIFTQSQTCPDYCKKLIFEKYVKAVTIVAPVQLQKPDELKAISYSLDESCANGVGSSNGWYHSPMEMPVLGLCLKSEEVDIPKRGIYSGTQSPLFPKALNRPVTPKPSVSEGYFRSGVVSPAYIFPELNTLSVTVPQGLEHWSMDDLSGIKDEPFLRYESACLIASPALSQRALQFLIDSKKIDWKYKRFIGSPMAGQICYGDRHRTDNAGRHKSTNLFFPITEKTIPSYDYEKALSVEEVVTRIKAFETEKVSPPPTYNAGSAYQAAAKAGTAVDNEAMRKAQQAQQKARNANRVAYNARAHFIGTLSALAQDDPRFAKEIAPQIAGDVIGRLYREELTFDTKLVYFLARLPADTLAPFTQELEVILTRALEASVKPPQFPAMAYQLAQSGEKPPQVECDDWACPSPLKGKQSLGSFPTVSMFAATGKAGLPLLDKANAAGFPEVDSVVPCLGAVPPNMLNSYSKTYDTARRYIFAALDISKLPIPETLPASPKLLRLFESAFNVRKPETAGRPGAYNRNTSGINLADGYSFQGKDIVFIGSIDPEILAYLKDNDLMHLLQYLDKRDYSYAATLMQTEFADEVKASLESELKRLKAATGSKPPKTIDLSKMKDNIIVNGTNIKDLADAEKLRAMEISEIETLLENWGNWQQSCVYRQGR